MNKYKRKAKKHCKRMCKAFKKILKALKKEKIVYTYDHVNPNISRRY